MKKTANFLVLCMLSVLLLSACDGEPPLDTGDRRVGEEKTPLPDFSPSTPYNVIEEKGIPVVRPDDPEQFKLYLDVLRPDSDGTFPTLIYATAYRRELVSLISSPSMVGRGYALVLMDVMGTGSSEGGWEVLSVREAQDIAWVIDHWIPAQPWSNGRVGMYGPSYMGITSLLTAGRRPKHLKAIFTRMTLGDAYRDIFFQGGIFNQQFLYLWGRLTAELSYLPPTQLLAPREGHFVEDVLSGVKALEEHHAQEDVVMGWLANTEDSEFFYERSPMTYWKEISEIPVMMTSGWWDIFTRGTTMTYTYTVRERDRKQTGSDHPIKMIVGPWYHASGSIGGEIPVDLLQQRWFDWHLKACDDPAYKRYEIMDPSSSVALYVLGEEKWRREKEWPLDRARNEIFYLSGERQIHDQNESLNNGSLFRVGDRANRACAAVDEEPTVLTYHPLQERERFTGMKSRSSIRWWMGATAFLPFAEDERENEKFLLTFSTSPLSQDLEVTGPAVLRLYARSTFGEAVEDPPPIWYEQATLWDVDPLILKPWAQRLDVHWTVNLDDVFPNGRVRNITSGWLAASHRPDPQRPDWTQTGYDPFDYPEDQDPTPPREGEVYEYVIEIWALSNVFKKGHQLRIDLSVTDYPHFLPSLVPSVNEVLHDEAHPSRLVLPVIDPETTDPDQWITDTESFFSGKEETWVNY